MNTGWTEQQEARIAHFQETTGCTRMEAVRAMRREEQAGKRVTEQPVKTVEVVRCVKVSGTSTPAPKPQHDTRPDRCRWGHKLVGERCKWNHLPAEVK